jgi:hypothetical protein
VGKQETESRKKQKNNCSNPGDFATSRAEVFPIANEAGGILRVGVHLSYLKSGIHAAEAGLADVC